jgi:hypothetical protein
VAANSPGRARAAVVVIASASTFARHAGIAAAAIRAATSSPWCGIEFTEAIELLTGETWPAPQLAETRRRREQHVASSNRPRAIRIWQESEPIFGTRAEVYLQSRGIDLEKISDIDDVLRFHIACPFGEAQRLPCLITLIRDIKTDAPIGVMRTALDDRSLGSRR